MRRPTAATKHNIISNSFFLNFQADISAGISALREFVMVGEAGFSALQGERVNEVVKCTNAISAK